MDQDVGGGETECMVDCSTAGGNIGNVAASDKQNENLIEEESPMVK